MDTLDQHKVTQILVSAAEIAQAVGHLSDRLRQTYEQASEVVVLVLLEGAAQFARDLLAELGDTRFIYTPLKVSSYHGAKTSSGQVVIQNVSALPLQGREVLIVDDIYDSGRTLSEVIACVRDCNPTSLRTCVLIAKDRPHEVPVSVDFIGLTIPDQFVIGYGLDYQGQFRDLPHIAVMNG